LRVAARITEPTSHGTSRLSFHENVHGDMEPGFAIRLKAYPTREDIVDTRLQDDSKMETARDQIKSHKVKQVSAPNPLVHSNGDGTTATTPERSC
jgi:hypothetical protein